MTRIGNPYENEWNKSSYSLIVAFKKKTILNQVFVDFSNEYVISIIEFLARLNNYQ